jgi:hypothetical protein
MLNSIDPLDKEEAAEIFQIFQVFQASGHVLDITALERCLRFKDYHLVIDMETMVRQPTDDELKRPDILLERMIKRLNSRCKGLLEALGSEKASETSLKYFMEDSRLPNDKPDDYSSSSAPPHSKATGIRNLFGSNISISYCPGLPGATTCLE